ncbi:hypothetical protein EC9_54620 [Rosistilla ulvae]|uniref:Uncharacterized protein n=1 Tax=Rosistilla ulvae TaxID=1930277 RepID=A0A517M8M6_9BACT|nr:hypothetical protein EC9_54620 [Rosistilla ulvae]
MGFPRGLCNLAVFDDEYRSYASVERGANSSVWWQRSAVTRISHSLGHLQIKRQHRIVGTMRHDRLRRQGICWNREFLERMLSGSIAISYLHWTRIVASRGVRGEQGIREGLQ